MENCRITAIADELERLCTIHEAQLGDSQADESRFETEQRVAEQWLANKLIMPAQNKEATSKDESLGKFLEMEGIWSEDAEGEEYYQMMKHRNDGRPLNREINLDD